MSLIDQARDFITSITGTKVSQYGDYSGPQTYIEGGLFGRGGRFEKKKPELLSPIVRDYQASPPQQQQAPQQQTPSSEYAAPSLQQPEQTPYPQRAWKNDDPYSFPMGDKPPVPKQYHEEIGKHDYPNIIASVLAQETGGYGYQVPDPETGETVSWQIAKEKNIRGASGEVGIAQIIPKWHFKAAGFPDEESYAQALYDPYFGIQEASRILNHAFDVYGDWKKALNTWNKAPSYPDDILSRIGVPLE